MSEPTIPDEVVKHSVYKGVSLLGAWRIHLGISPDEMGKRLGGLTASEIHELEAPSAVVSIYMLKKWASALGISVEEITLD